MLVLTTRGRATDSEDDVNNVGGDHDVFEPDGSNAGIDGCSIAFYGDASCDVLCVLLSFSVELAALLLSLANQTWSQDPSPSRDGGTSDHRPG